MASHSSVLALENPRDGGGWWAAIYGVAQSRTRLKRLSSSSSSHEESPKSPLKDTKCLLYFIYFKILAPPLDLWDLSSQTRNSTLTLSNESTES